MGTPQQFGRSVNGATPNLSMLDLHWDRRRAHVPTVSLLRGAIPAGAGRFRNWAASRKLWVATIVMDGVGDVTTKCLAALGAHPALRNRAVATVAAAAETTVESVNALVDSHSRDAAVLFDRAARVGLREAAACASLGRRVPTPPGAERFLAELLLESAEAPALVALVDQVTPQSSADLCSLVSLAQSTPALAMGVAIPPEVYAEVMDGPDARWKALVREGLVDVVLEAPPPAPPGLAPAHVEVRDALVGRGSSDAVLAFDRVVTLSQNCPTNVARSAFEAILFSVLEEHAETAGLFELNGKLDFKFGTRAAEVDLVSRRLGIAVEIDGYFHFAGGANAYRRDRRKDRLLQEHGYRVLRFLADDIVPQLFQITSAICETVRARKQEDRA